MVSPGRRFRFRFARGRAGSDAPVPVPVSVSPRRREGRGPRGGGRWPARDIPCPCVSRPRVSPVVPVSPCPSPVPVLRWPRPHGFLSPSSVRVALAAGLERCQREAEEVAELMRQNVAKALEREGHLEQLQSRAQDLRQASEAFTRTTRTVTRRQRRRHRRWHLVALGLGLLLLLILALALALALARASPGAVTSAVPTPQGGTQHPPSTAGTL
ncbi:uncharacterized protein LOC134428436 [Melospiza melodia melodia]|uniref:uncharacterized protein LOC134428436 n=1 Tax=Melospiza melodia melodia TaxID=1914991 RepID=UPI002FD6CD84